MAFGRITAQAGLILTMAEDDSELPNLLLPSPKWWGYRVCHYTWVDVVSRMPGKHTTYRLNHTQPALSEYLCTTFERLQRMEDTVLECLSTMCEAPSQSPALVEKKVKNTHNSRPDHAVSYTKRSMPGTSQSLPGLPEMRPFLRNKIK